MAPVRVAIAEIMSKNDRPFPRLTAFIAAALVAGAVGAASGQAIGDTPILRGGSEQALPLAKTPYEAVEGQTETERPPDHYPLVTPDGTIPVAELALHGRMRDRDDGWYAVEEPVFLDAQYEDDFSEAEIDRLARPVPTVAEVRIDQTPGPLPQPQQSDNAAEGVRIVDVSAALDDARGL